MIVCYLPLFALVDDTGLSVLLATETNSISAVSPPPITGGGVLFVLFVKGRRRNGKTDLIKVFKSFFPLPLSCRTKEQASGVGM